MEGNNNIINSVRFNIAVRKEIIMQLRNEGVEKLMIDSIFFNVHTSQVQVMFRSGKRRVFEVEDILDVQNFKIVEITDQEN